MRVGGVYIRGIGVVLGEPVKTEKAIAEGLYEEDLYRITRLTQTHIAGDVPALTMAVDAAKEALARSDLDINDVDAHIHVGNPQQGARSEGVPLYGYVLRELGGVDIHATEIRQGCNGFFGAIDGAVGFLTGAANYDNVLITAGENWTSPLIDRWHGGPDIIYGDGGVAAVLSGESGFAEIVSANSSTLPEFEEWHRGNSTLLPQRDLVYEVPDPAKYVQEFMRKGISLPEIVERWSKFYFDICYRSLADADINSSDVAMIIPSNSDGRQFEQLLFDPLGIPVANSSVDFGRGIGHVGACDQMISLEHFASAGRLAPGDYVLLVSSGPGITSNSIVLRMTDTPAAVNR